MPKRRSVNPSFNKRLQRIKARPLPASVATVPVPPPEVLSEDPEQLEARQYFKRALRDISPKVIRAQEKREFRALKRLAALSSS